MAGEGNNSGAFIKVGADVNGLIKGLNEAVNAMFKFEKDFSASAQRIKNTFAEIDANLSGSQIGIKSIEKLSTIAPENQSVSKYKGVLKRYNEIKKGVESLEVSNKSLEVSNKSLEESYRRINNLTLNTGWARGFENYSQSANNFSVAVKGLGLQIYAVSGLIATSLGGALSGILKTSLSVGGGFETSMKRVEIISKATGSELNALSQKAREMGRVLPVTASEAADAMEILAQRGTSARNVLKSVENVSNLAISQNVDMQAAADLLGAVMTSYEISVNDAAKVTDIFNNAANQSALNISKLKDSMTYIAPVASAAGMSLEDSVAAMEVLANAGFRGEMIGTGLAKVIQVLAKQSVVLGVSTHDTEGNFRKLGEIFQELQTKGIGLSGMTEIFGEEAAKAGLNLAKYSGQLSSNAKNLQNWGVTAKAVEAQMGTWGNTWKTFMSATESIRITIFDQIKEKSKSTVASITNIINVIENWIKRTGVAGEVLKSFMEGLSGGFTGAEGIGSYLQSINMADLKAGFKSVGDALRDIFLIFKKLSIIIKEVAKWSLVFSGTLVKFGVATYGFGKLVSLAKNINLFIQVCVTAAPIVKNVFGSISNLIAGAYQGVKGLISSFGLLGGSAAALGISLAAAAIATGAFLAAWKTGEYIGKKVLGWLDDLRNAINEKHRENYFKSETEEAEKYIEVIKRIKTGYEDVNAIMEEIGLKNTKMRRLAYENADRKKEANENNEQKLMWGAAAELNRELGYDQRQFYITTDEIAVWERALIEAYRNGGKAVDDMSGRQKILLDKMNEMVELGNMPTALEQNIVELNTKQRQELERASLNSGDNLLRRTTQQVNKELEKAFQTLQRDMEKTSQLFGNTDIGFELNYKAAREQITKGLEGIAPGLDLPVDVLEAKAKELIETYARAGNQMAQGLLDGWNNEKPQDKITQFINDAKEAMTYMGASPEQFIPALSVMGNNMDKIDKKTGKLSEGFKKCLDTLKEWGNITFNNLQERIGKISDAVKNGFVDHKALEGEFENAFKQVQLRVAMEYKDKQNQFDAKTFSGVLKSEIQAGLQGMKFGDEFLAPMKAKFDELSKTAGGDFAKAIYDSLEIQNRNAKNSVASNKSAADLQNAMAAMNPQQALNTTIQNVIPKFDNILSANQSGFFGVTSTITSLTTTVSEAASRIVTAMDRNTEAVRNISVSGTSNGKAEPTQIIQNNTVELKDFTVRQESDIQRITTLIKDALRNVGGSFGRGFGGATA